MLEVFCRSAVYHMSEEIIAYILHLGSLFVNGTKAASFPVSSMQVSVNLRQNNCHLSQAAGRPSNDSSSKQSIQDRTRHREQATNVKEVEWSWKEFNLQST